MITAPVITLIDNAALLLALGLVYDLLPWKRHPGESLRRVGLTVAIGLIGIAVMLNPWEVVPGVYLDTRCILLSLAGLFFGIVPTLAAVVSTTTFRLYQGGAGMMTGIAIIVTSAGIGLAWRYLRPRSWKHCGRLELLLFGLVVSAVFVLLLLTLPRELVRQSIEGMLLTTLVVYPLSTLLMGRILARQNERREERSLVRERERRFRKMVEQGWDILCLLDGKGVVKHTSESTLRILGIPPSKVTGGTIHTLVYSDDVASFGETLDTLASRPGHTATIETRMRHRDGRWLWMEIALTNLMEDPDVAAVVLNARDVTERNRALERAERLNRVHTVLSNINQAIVRTQDPGSLLEEVCRIAVRDGGLKAAWIALTDPASGTPRVAAHAGIPREAIDAFMSSLHAESATHPVAATFGSGTRAICDDAASNPNLAAWRDHAMRHECPALAAFPLKVFGATKGALILCADRPDFFDTGEIRLLDELTMDLSFAMEYAEQAMQRRIAERERESIEWMLDRVPVDSFEQRISTGSAEDGSWPMIPKVVGESILRDIMADFIGLLDTCAVVYERNGDPALRVHSSDWCATLNETSRGLYGTGTDREAMETGRWLCHESCWTDTTRAAIERGGPVEGPCRGGLTLFAAPITAGDRVEGGICIAYGNPPTDPAALSGISACFGVPEPVLRKAAESYLARPPFIIQEAKRRLLRAARLIGEIIERKRAEEALQLSESRYRSLFEDSLAVMLLIDPATGVILDANPAATAYYGWTRETLRSMKIQEINTLSPEQVQAEMTRAKAENRNRFLFTHRLADGSIRDVEVYSGPIQTGADVHLYSIVHDVTDRRLAEEERDRKEIQLRQAQKMEAIGRLAGGIAHDFNNMLNIILGYTDIALRELHPEQSLYQDLGEVRKAGEHAADLVRQLLAFSRRQVVEPRVVNLGHVLADRLKMLRRLIGEDIEISVSLPDRLWNILIDPSQLDQILINLAANARDAIGGVGTVAIEVVNITLDVATTHRDISVTAGDYVMMAFSDTGTGMDASTLERIFEPFFTTKRQGKGTGLGLATVYGIVKQVDGVIHTYSEPGLGTTFKVYFPRVHGEAGAGVEPAVAPGDGGKETVLVVEDEPQILELIDRVLDMQGYTVLKAPSPDIARRLAADHRGEIHLLLTDVVMPTMNGRELQAFIREGRPEIRTLFMSGYTANVIAHRGVLDEDVAFLPKPFSIDLLTRKVREVLDAPSEDLRDTAH